MNGARRGSLSEVLTRANRKEFLRKNFCAEGFTLIELLVVVAVIAMLAATLLPALAASKAGTKADRCMDNTRQLTLGWLMYASDNRSELIPYTGWVGHISGEGWLSTSTDNTNALLLIGGGSQDLMAQYIHQSSVYKCPSDIYQKSGCPTGTDGYRVRSYSVNIALGPGGGPTVLGHGLDGNRTYYGAGSFGVGRNAQKMADLLHPSMVFVILDEQGDSISGPGGGDAVFAFNPGGSPYGGNPEKWRDLPASYHNGACCLSFADGHSLIHSWQVRSGFNKTLYPVTTMDGYHPWTTVNLGVSPDYEWMDDHMPYR